MKPLWWKSARSNKLVSASTGEERLAVDQKTGLEWADKSAWWIIESRTPAGDIFPESIDSRPVARLIVWSRRTTTTEKSKKCLGAFQAMTDLYNQTLRAAVDTAAHLKQVADMECEPAAPVGTWGARAAGRAGRCPTTVPVCSAPGCQNVSQAVMIERPTASQAEGCKAWPDIEAMHISLELYMSETRCHGWGRQV